MGQVDGVGAVDGAEDAQDPLNVCFDRVFADVHLPSDLGIGIAVGNKAEDYQHAGTQLLVTWIGGGSAKITSGVVYATTA